MKNREKLGLALCAALYAAVTCTMALIRNYTFKGSLLDNGYQQQAFWNLLHHHGYVSNGANWLSFHFSPLVLILLPLYAVWPHWELLQIAHGLGFTSAGVILFYALKAAGAQEREAFAGALLYWLNPFVLGASITDFHEIAFANPLLALGGWALYARRFTALVVTCLLLVLTKEHYGLAMAGFGFLWGWRYSEWRRAIFLMSTGIIAFCLIMFVLLPGLHGGTHFMMSHDDPSMDRYGWLTDPWPIKIKSLYFIIKDDIGYLFLMAMSALFGPLLAPLYMAPAAADLAANLLSKAPFPREPGTYHSAAIVVVAIMAGFQGYKRISQAPPAVYRTAAAIAVVAVVCLASMSSAVLNAWQLEMPYPFVTPPPSGVVSALPEGAISAQKNIGTFFSTREKIYPFPVGVDNAEAVILYLKLPFARPGGPNAFRLCGEKSSYFPAARRLLQDPQWHVAFWQAPWLVMARGASPKDEHDVKADITLQLTLFEKAALSPSVPAAWQNQ